METKIKCKDCAVVCSYCPFNYHCKEKKLKNMRNKQDNEKTIK